MSELPTDAQLDGLRELANIGCGNAATALSQLVGGRAVRIDVPSVHASAADPVELAGGMARVVAARLAIEGDVDGHLLVLWPEADARELARLMLGAAEQGPLTEEPQKSALSEAANIVASACLSAVGTLTRLRLLPSPPELLYDEAEVIVGDCLRDGHCGDAAVVLQTRFIAAHSPPLCGHLLLVPARRSMRKLFAALGLE